MASVQVPNAIKCLLPLKTSSMSCWGGSDGVVHNLLFLMAIISMYGGWVKDVSFAK